MTYEPLTEATVIPFVQSRAPLRAALSSTDALEAAEVGDGNLNLVFLVRSTDNPSVSIIVKQALPYLRVAGADWRLTRDRMRIETAALRLYNELAPGRSPAILDADDSMSFVAMEYLAEHRIMRLPLIAGDPLPQAADHLADFMAAVHFATSDVGLSGPAKKALVSQFMNPGLCELQEDFVFSNPFMESAENRWNPALDADVRKVRADGELKIAIAEVKVGHMTHAQALLHGDFHTGSVMVTETDTRIIDPEFAFVGPIGHDIGTLLANLAIDHLAHEVHSADALARAAYRSALIGMMTRIWTRYAAEFERLWRSTPDGDLAPAAYWSFDGGDTAAATFRRHYLDRILADSAGYGGCEILRRLMGIVSVPELTSIADEGARARVERGLIEVARAWLLRRPTSIGDLTGHVTEASLRLAGSAR